MEAVRGVVLIGATITVGLMAGVFFAFAVAVMRGLGRTDDRTFVAGFQAIDRAIINPVFLAAYLGALGFTVLAGLLHVGEDARRVLPWVVAAAVLYLAAFVVTVRVHLPLNDRIKAAGDPDRVDVIGVRGRFDETRWVRWNVVRAVVSTAALACLGWALVLHGQAG